MSNQSNVIFSGRQSLIHHFRFYRFTHFHSQVISLFTINRGHFIPTFAESPAGETSRALGDTVSQTGFHNPCPGRSGKEYFIFSVKKFLYFFFNATMQSRVIFGPMPDHRCSHNLQSVRINLNRTRNKKFFMHNTLHPKIYFLKFILLITIPLKSLG